jgi:hypothetical protein
MVFDRLNERVRQHIITELGIDVFISTRERYNVEARCLYYTILKELTPTQSLEKIGRSINKDHATVIYGLGQYESFCFYNKNLDLIKRKIIILYNSANDLYKVEYIDDEIYRLEQMVVELKKQRETIIFNKTLTEVDLVV